MSARVAIVGAGLAGLAAARRLAAAGLEVTLLECEEQAGGRARSRDEAGLCVERALPLLREGRPLLRWLKGLPLSEPLLPPRPLELAQVGRGGDEERLVEPALWGVARSPGLRPLDAARSLRFPRLLRRYRAQLDPNQPERAARWDDRSVADFARLYFGPSGYERWVAPTATALADGETRSLSRVVFLLAALEGQAAVGLPLRGLQAAIDAASVGLDLRTATRVERVECAGAERYALHAEARDLGSVSLDADAVVCCLEARDALRVAPDLVTPAEREILGAVPMGQAVVASLGLERPAYPRARFVRVPEVEAAQARAWTAEPGSGPRAPLGAGRVSLAATLEFAERSAAAPGEAAAKELADVFERLVPSARGALCSAQVERSRVPVFEVGAYRRLAQLRRVEADRRAQGRRLYWAGDHLQGPTPEHGLVSGLRAADALLEDLGARSPSRS